MASDYISDAIIIAVVAFAQSVSLAALMAKKHMYIIDSNQVRQLRLYNCL